LDWNFSIYTQKYELLDNSLIILTADHGEAFGEHGDFGYGEIKANLYGEVTRIPSIYKLQRGEKELWDIKWICLILHQLY
jgi:arylsulfatase